jgi:triosephosphate isomerase
LLTLGVSLKAYFGYSETLRWAERVRQVAGTLADGLEFFVVPSFPAIPLVVEIFRGSGVLVGAQNIAHDDSGALTGETGGRMLAEIGCSIAEIGHAERRALFGETDELVALKVAAAYRNGLTPLLCVGEPEPGDPAAAAEFAIAQLDAALARSDERGRMIVAYEPRWAIGAPTPADPAHVGAVCAALREHLVALGMAGSPVLYGGSAGPGLLERLGASVDGLFLGRFAHDPASVAAVLHEAARVNGRSDTRKTPGTGRDEAGGYGGARSVTRHEEEGL